MLKKIVQFQFFKELLIVLILLISYNNFLYKKNPDKKEVFINADGRGYYEYLPALFIYDDIHLAYIDTLQTEYYEIEHNKLLYKYQENGLRINKYFVGTALFQSPFFLVAHFTSSKADSIHPDDGFSLPYQRAIWYAAIFYMFLGMVCIRLLLQTYNMNGWWIFFIQIATLFATPLLHYTVYDSAYSHVYSFFLISWLMYTVRKYFITNQSNYLFLSLVILGFITIVRPVNLLVLIFTPLLTDHLSEFIRNIQRLFTQHYYALLFGVVCYGVIVSIQLYISYLQTGNPFNYSYGEEGFDFTHPRFVDFLFSYQKGFFLWTPWWLLVFIIGLICWVYKKIYYQAIAFLLAFLIVVYVLSSWHSWSYGGSIGQRPMIDFYGAFILVLLPVFSKRQYAMKGILVISLPLLVVLMQIQTFQYVKAIILLDGMNKELYWKSFLITDEKYSWYFYRSSPEIKDIQSERLLLKEIIIPAVQQQFYVQTFNIPSPDTLASGGEIKFRLNREADREFIVIELLNSMGQVVSENSHNVFHSQYGDDVVLRFKLPEKSQDITQIRFAVSNVNQPLKIEGITFSTFFN